ncbi:uncharacterized protein LOC128993846 [Macrosteles quadrilineatus]|uniref:uncharacterized protein LOC128993846 n=1 Tax=Macrosteles quadrilineatus TaxID=74068 RepID=UPI0023E29853|nr:uncharacterized protein LOC128993846 [Macrosteles quadrilineatus]
MYRSPSGSILTFLRLLNQCLYYLTTLGLSVVIGTDHNIDLLKPTSEARDFLNLLRSFNIYSSIIEPTRGKASLDTFLTNFDCWNYRAWVSRDQIADHQHVILSLSTGPKFDLNGEELLAGYRFFNHLPVAIRDLPISRFKAVVKDWLIENPFYDLSEFYKVGLPVLL